ncbi:MAG: hypothetical protein WKF74_11115 [Pyrinomonadaceae bacterium]
MYLRRCDEQAIISRSPGLSLIPGVLFGAAGLSFVYFGISQLSSHDFNQTTLAFLVMGLVGCGIGYRVSSPFFLSIDRTKLTYQGYRNWFPFRQQLAGGWEDFDHLSLKHIPGKAGGTWTVELNWSDTGRESFTLYLANGRSVGLEEAQRRGVVLPKRWDEAQAAAIASSPLRFLVHDTQLEAQHQALVLASLLNLPLVDERNQPIAVTYR